MIMSEVPELRGEADLAETMVQELWDRRLCDGATRGSWHGV